MRYIELILTVPAAHGDIAAAFMRDELNDGVWIETPFTQADMESDAIPSSTSDLRLHGYVIDGGDAGRAARQLLDQLDVAGVFGSITQRTVAEEDWADSWKQYFDVARYGDRIVVVPSWRTYERSRDDIVLQLDPGMAFGTGQHETTRMCLEALERSVRPDMRVLDIGCGSGILSLAAAKLGAAEVVALDIDENCVRVTSENARANGVEDIVRARAGSVGSQWLPRDPPASFDVAVANIIARVILELADDLVAALASRGVLIASGIIAEHEAAVCRALAARGLEIVAVRALGDWRCIEAVAGAQVNG